MSRTSRRGFLGALMAAPAVALVVAHSEAAPEGALYVPGSMESNAGEPEPIVSVMDWLDGQLIFTTNRTRFLPKGSSLPMARS